MAAVVQGCEEPPAQRARAGPGVAAAVACCCGFAAVGRSVGTGFVGTPPGALALSDAPTVKHQTLQSQGLAAQPGAGLRGAARADTAPTWAPGALGGGLALGLGVAVSRRAYRRRQAQLGFSLPMHVRGTRVDAGHTARKVTLTMDVAEDEDTDVVPPELMQNANLVKKNSVLVLGATGTLGRQVVRQFLNAGYSVRCMIRNKVDRPFSFLVDWGATVIEGSLARPETLPSGLIGIHTVIDCATARPEESIYDIDWEGKKRFIQCCDAMDVQRYIFISIKDCDKYTNVPLMQIKDLTEKFLAKTRLRYTTLRVSGFMQPLVSEYAVPVLDDQQVWGDDGSSPGIAYMDSQDTARMVAAAVNKECTVGQTLTLSGPKIWSASEVITLCEKLSGRTADVNVVSNTQLQITQNAAGLFQWTVDVAERLRFVEVNQMGDVGGTKVMDDKTYSLLGMDPTATRDLEEYVGEFYRRVFKKLTKGKYEPDKGEIEREKAEEERKLQIALQAGQEDKLPEGQPAEKDVSVILQRELADNLQRLFEDRKLEEIEGEGAQIFGWTKVSEAINGRSAMVGFSLGLFTEWATNVSVSKQIGLLLAIFTSPS